MSKHILHLLEKSGLPAIVAEQREEWDAYLAERAQTDADMADIYDSVLKDSGLTRDDINGLLEAVEGGPGLQERLITAYDAFVASLEE